MSKYKIENAWICKIKGENVLPVFGDLEIIDEKISKIKRKSFSSYLKTPQDKSNRKNVYDAKGSVLTIPLVNFHEHFYSRLAKGLEIKGETDSFISILENLWWKLDRALTLDAVRFSAEMGVLESIKNGVTYIFDHHASPSYVKGSLAVISRILEKYKVRGVLAFEISDRNGDKITDASFSETENFYSEFSNSNIQAMLGLHASFTVSDNTLKRAKELSEQTGLPIHIHLCEDKADRTESKKNYGNFPAQRLAKFGLLNDKTILAHGIHLNKKEYETISKYNSAIALNPDSNLNNAVGLPNFNLIKNITLLSGTDGMHANPLRTLKNIFLLSRHSGLSFDESFELITKMFFGQLEFVKKYFPDFTGLSEGERADFVIWDYVPPTPINKNNFFGHYLYGIAERSPKSVFQGGKPLMIDKILVNIDEEEINKSIFNQGKKLARKFSKM